MTDATERAHQVIADYETAKSKLDIPGAVKVIAAALAAAEKKGREGAVVPILSDCERRIKAIKADARFNAPPANTDVNAALALVQTVMESRLEILEIVVGQIRALRRNAPGGE